MLKYVWNSLAKTKYINWSQAYALIKDIIDINKHAFKKIMLTNLVLLILIL